MKYLKREVSIQFKLKNERIIDLYYILESKHYIFLVMELMKGGSLREYIIEKYKSNDYFIKDEDAAMIIKNILDGLSLLHKLNIEHRDIKPENIMFKEKNNLNSLKIGDFGVSSCLIDEDRYCGTVIYMAPEIAKTVQNRTGDIWACGFILFILCSGGKHPLYKINMNKEEYKKKIEKT